MGTRTGQASVDVVADVHEFGSQMTRDLNKELKNVKVDGSEVADKLSEDVDKGVKDAEKSLGRLADNDAGKKLAENIGDGVDHAAASLGKFGDAVDAAVDDVGPKSEKLGEQLGDGITRGIDGKLRDAKGRFVKGGEDAGQAAGKGFGKGWKLSLGEHSEFNRQLAITASRFSLIGLAGAASAPGVLHLVAALAPAAGALVAIPAAALAFKAALGVVKIATAGVGEAITKGLTGTAEQAEKALKDLPPAAQTFAKSIIALKPQLDGLRAAVAGRFFKPFQDEITATSGVYLPMLTKEMSNTAGVLGGLAEQFLTTARKADVVNGVRDTFTATRLAALNLRGAIDPLVTALSVLIQSTAPELPGMAQGFTDLATRASQWLIAMVDAGKVNDVFDKGVATLKDLAGLVGNVGSILMSVFSAATAGGTSLLGNLRDLTGQAAAFLKSAEGTEALTLIFSTLSQVGQAMRGALAAALPAIARALGEILPVVGQLAPSFTDLVVAVAPLLPIVAQIAATVVGALVPGISALTGWLAQNTGVVKAAAVAFALYAAAAKASAAATTVQAAGGLVAWAKGLSLVTTATKIATAAQAAFGVAIKFALGPVGLVITAIGLLIAGLVLLYNKNETFRNFVNQVWNGIKVVIGAVVDWIVGTAWPLIQAAWQGIAAGAMWLWNNAIKPAFDGIAAAVQWVGQAVTWLWTNIYLPYFTLIGNIAMWLWNNVLSPAFQGIATVLRGAAVVIMWLWNNVVSPAFQGIGILAMWLWNNVLSPAFQGIGILIQAAGAYFSWLWSVVGPPLRAIGSLVLWLWQQVFSIAWAGIKAATSALAAVIIWLWQNVTLPAIKGIGQIISWLWTNAVMPTFNLIKAAVNAAAAVFRALWNNYISPAVKNISNGIRVLYNSVILPIFNSIKSTIVSRIQAAVAVVGAIKSFVSQVSANFTSLINSVKSKLNSVVSTVKGLPGRIKSAIGNLGSLLYNAGANIIQGLINGIASKLGALRDKAAAAASAVRNLFPFSPAKEGPLSGSGSPEIAGGKIASMIAAGMQANTPKLYEAARAMAAATSAGGGRGLDFAGQGILRSAIGANGSGAVSPGAGGGGTIVFSDGAIRVTFSGAVPTEAEAFRTGQAIGSGIASTLASRSVHNTVRTL